MDDSTMFGLIALVVSLIALFISLTQLLQSSALTAEGWRHCNATNMGQWSVFSRRKWLWSELRCEVRYTTPFIRLIDTSTLFGVQEYGGDCRNFFVKSTDAGHPWNSYHERLWDCVRKSSPSVPNHPEELGWGLVFEEACRFERPESRVARAASHILGFRSLPNNIEEHWRDQGQQPTRRVWSLWLSFQRWFRGYHFRFESQPLSSRWRTKTKRMSITWDNLLRLLLHSQLRNFHARTSRSKVSSIVELKNTQDVSIVGATRSEPAAETPNLRSGETLFVVDLERRSWDFLPPDVTKPLARTTMKSVVVLARRLGMRWKMFDLVNEHYRAEGNGCNLTATNVRGVGMVFRFDTNYVRDSEPVLCSADADKAYFGIIPGDKSFNIEDYPLVADDGHHDMDVIVRALGEKPKQLRKTLHFWGRVVTMDVIALVCPFAPLEDTRVPRIFTPMGTLSSLEIMVKLSIFRAFGLETGLREELNRRLATVLNTTLEFPNPDLPGSWIDTSIRDLFANHRLLKTRYRPITELQGARNSKTDSSATRTASKLPRDVNSDDMTAFNELKTLRMIHKAVSDKLREELPMGGLMHLVEAHMSFVSERILDWWYQEPEYQKRSDKRKDEPKNHTDNDLSNGWTTLVEEFCEKLMKDLNPFKKYLTIAMGEDEIKNKDVESLWWLLVARGVAWQMSVNVVRQSYSDIVPSSVYDSELSVWIE